MQSKGKNMASKKTTRRNDARGNGKWQGMNWCRQDLRLAIHLRDGLACAWCGHAHEDGASLTLDHLKPHSKGGDNKPTNLVCCCERCNKSRGNRSVKAFAVAVAAYLNHGVQPAEIEDHVKTTARKPIAAFRAEAKELIARRGSAARVLASIK